MRTTALLAAITLLALGCEDGNKRGYPQPGIVLGGGTVHAQQAAVVERTDVQQERNAAALKTIREHWDSEIITGNMVDEIKKVLDQADPADLEPLLERLELLESAGKVYAPDFALWWEVRGRAEIGGKVFWRRDLLREAVGVAMVNEDEARAVTLLREAAATGDPVARMWQVFVDAEHFGRHDARALGDILKLVNESRELADAGDADAAYFLGLFAMEGDNDLIRSSPEELVAWLEMAADAGYAHAARMLADAYGRGRHGIQRDANRAQAWNAKADDENPERRAAELRDTSQNHLKQLALIGKMYANESRGERWPALSAQRGQLAMNAAAIYPEYMTDASVYVSPAHPDYYDLIEVAKSDPRSAIRDDSYWYLGYAIGDEAQGLALIRALREAMESGESLPDKFETPELPTQSIFGLRNGIERFFITDIHNPAASAVAQSQIPIMIERPGLHKDGINVLYLDGHVEFRQYPGEFPASKAFIEALESLDDLKG